MSSVLTSDATRRKLLVSAQNGIRNGNALGSAGISGRITAEPHIGPYGIRERADEIRNDTSSSELRYSRIHARSDCGRARPSRTTRNRRRLVTLLDRVTLVVIDHRSVDRLIYDGSTLQVGGKHLDLT